MRSVLEINESIQEKKDEIKAFRDVAEREQRDLSADQKARVFELLEELKVENNNLEFQIEMEKEMMTSAEARIKEKLAEHQAQNGRLDSSGNSLSPKFGPIKIPASAKNHGPLKAYQGPDAERNAYIAGNVILAGLFSNQKAAQFCKNHGLQVNMNMTGGTNTSGGFFVPDEMSQAIIRLREERGVFPNFANRVPMGSDIIRVPRLLSDVTAYWVGEGAEITASDPTVGAAELMARKLGALTKVSSELDEDAVIEIGDMITQSMAYAMADKIDEAAFNGDGTSAYGGVQGLKNALHANAVQGAATGNDSALTLDLADFEATIGKYPQYPGAAPRWFMHSAVYWASCARLVDAAGGNTTMTLASGPQMMFLGYPVTFTNVMPSTTGTLASTIVAYFGDLRLGATYGTRRSVRTEVSLDRYFENDLIGIKTTERVAINIHERGEDIRTRPIVALKTAA